MFERLTEHKDALESALSVRLTEHRLFALALAYAGPCDADDLVAAVLAVEPSPLYDRLHRLRHRNAAHRLLRDLKGIGLLQRGMRRGRVVFRLRRGARSRMVKVLDS